jgi:hypothetical protein
VTARNPQPRPDDGAGRPSRATSRRRDRRPLQVRVELVAVDGEAGKLLAQRQAAVIREVLQWFHDHPPGVDRAVDDATGPPT